MRLIKNYLKQIRYSIIFLSLLPVMVLFQNCDQNNFQTKASNTIELASENLGSESDLPEDYGTVPDIFRIPPQIDSPAADMSNSISSADDEPPQSLQLTATTGHIFYLNPSLGKDTSSGSINAPWKTLSKAITSVNAGDKIYIRGGTYSKTQFYASGISLFQWKATHRLGRAGAPITLQSYPGEKVIIDGKNSPYFIYFLGVSGYNGHYVVVRELEFRNFKGVAIGANLVRNLTIDSCILRNFADQQAGGIGTIDSERLIIKNSRFENMGVSDDHMHAIYVSKGTKKLLLEGNYFRGTSGHSVHGYGHGDSTRSYEGLIIRRNTSINPWAVHVLVGAGSSTNTYIYQNTFFSTHKPYPSRDSLDTVTGVSIGTGTHKNFHIKNNIGYGPMRVAMVNIRATAVNLTMTHNLFFNTNDQNRDYSFSGIFYSLANFLKSKGYGANSFSMNPRFVSESNLNLNLTSASPVINKGTFLTTTKSAGSGRSLPVIDSRYFNDGFDMVPGDLIQVGSTQVRIVSINSSQHILNLDRSISWTSGQGVALPYKGTRPDMGAYEF